MVRRTMSKCPPGVWCLTPMLGTVITIIAILGILGLVLYFFQGANHPSARQGSGGSGGSGGNEQRQERQERQERQGPVINNIVSNGDDRYTRAPEPLRFWQSAPDLRGALLPPGAVAINQDVRGVPQTFQQFGIIKSDDKLLPLYGRKTAYRSDRFNYYTRTDTYNPVQLPIRYERKDCMDNIGCNELFGGETVKIKGIDKDGRVEIYKFDGPSYIPGIV